MNKLSEPLWTTDFLAPDPRVSLDRGLRLLWHWKRLFLLVISTICLIGVGYLALADNQYTARAVMAVGFQLPELTTLDRQLPPDSDIDGAVEMMTAPAAPLAAGNQLNLGDRPETQSVGIFQPRGSKEDRIVVYLRKHLVVQRVGHANFVSVAFTAHDPKLAAQVANAIANNSATGTFPQQMTVAERSGFYLPKTVVVSSAVVPFEPSSPNVPLIILATLFLGICAATTAILLRDFYAQQAQR